MSCLSCANSRSPQGLWGAIILQALLHTHCEIPQYLERHGLQCNSNAPKVHASKSIKRLTHSPTHALPYTALWIAWSHLRKCKYGTQQVKLKVKFSFSPFLQNPVNRLQDKKRADSSCLIFIIRACSGREQGLVVTGVYSLCCLNFE